MERYKKRLINLKGDGKMYSHVMTLNHILYTKEIFMSKRRNTKNKSTNNTNTNIQTTNTNNLNWIQKHKHKFCVGAIITFVITGIAGGILSSIGERITQYTSNIINMPNAINEINTSVEDMQVRMTEMEEKLNKIQDYNISQKFDTYDKALEQYDETLKCIRDYLMQNSALKVELTNNIAISQPITNTDEYTLIQPTWTSEQIIAIDMNSKKNYKAKELNSTPLLIPYMEGSQEVYFLGQFNEKNHWDGNCILNVYEHNQLQFIMEAVYEDGQLKEYKQVSAEYSSTKGDTWVVSNRIKESDYNIGESWTYSRKDVPKKNFTMDTVESEYIYTMEDFHNTMNLQLLSYYNGRTSDGKYNDQTGNAYLIRYAEDGTILILYQGGFKNGYFHDDTYNAWDIARDPEKGAEKYMYYKGVFQDGDTKPDENSKPEMEIPLSRIFEIVQESGIQHELTWYKY